LTQPVLAKAFRGELVPTEAELARREGLEYEPASVLLERIKVERAKTKPGKLAKRRMHPRLPNADRLPLIIREVATKRSCALGRQLHPVERFCRFPSTISPCSCFLLLGPNCCPQTPVCGHQESADLTPRFQLFAMLKHGRFLGNSLRFSLRTTCYHSGGYTSRPQKR
jgi:hypothetical protein